MKSPTPITNHTPILTIKIKDVVTQSQIGREWLIEATPVGFGTNTLRIRRGKQNTFLLQTSWDTKYPPSVVLQIKITEKDKINDIFGPAKFDLGVDKTLPVDNDSKKEIITGHRKKQKTISITVKGIGGDAGKTATIQILFEWFLSSNMLDLVSYIHGEMINNLNTKEFTKLKRNLKISNSLKFFINYLLAMTIDNPAINLKFSNSELYRDFSNLVGDGHQWDHKAAIYPKCGEWSIDAEKGQLYRFDIFSNIHYGYIGRALGFNKYELLDGAGLAQALREKKSRIVILAHLLFLRKLDDPIDQEAIKLGMDIWSQYKGNINKDILLQKIRIKRQWKGGRKKADEGVPKKN